MKEVVIYNSSSGFTKKYAMWISEAIGCEMIAFKEAKKRNFSSFDTIIFGSWCHAGFIKEIAWFKELMKRDKNKKYIVFAVGASPINSPDIEVSLANNINEEYRDICQAFYCPGGLNYQKMTTMNRMMMKMFAKMMANKKDKTEAEKVMAEMISHDYDISDKKYITPILECINEK